MTEFSPEGVEHQVSSSLVPIGGKLPNFIEVQTGKLLNILIDLPQNPDVNRSQLRSKINKWLYTRTRPNFYIEMHEYLHLAYADQRSGSGTQHWWRLFFDDRLKQKIENITKSSALTVNEQQTEQTYQSATGDINPSKEWGGMHFRVVLKRKGQVTSPNHCKTCNG